MRLLAPVLTAFAGLWCAAAQVSAGPLVLNEVLASNREAVENGGEYPDYVEIRNNGEAALSLAGYALTDDPLESAKYSFPGDVSIPAGGYLVVWCDTNTAAPGLHAGFALDADGESVLLMNGSTVEDSVTFGPQAPDVSIGLVADGTGEWQAGWPTPGAGNSGRSLGPATNLRINEWMADPLQGDDWFEIHNLGSSVVPLAGLYLSDTPSSPRITQIPALSFIEGRGFTRFRADDGTGGNHANFKLSRSGDSLVLTASNGTTTIDTVTFGSQPTDASQGRLPDGSSNFVSFTAKTASPGSSNWAPSPVVINEVLSNSSAPFEDAIELHNTGTTPLTIGGWWLSDSLVDRQKYRIPTGTSIPAGGYRVFYAAELAAGMVPFEFDARGGVAVLSHVDVSGNLSGYGSMVRFGASDENVSFGRAAATGLGPASGGAEFWTQAARSFGRDNPASVADFRTGTGAANGATRTGPVVITEVQYHPPDISGAIDDTRDEFIEIANAGGGVDLGGWRLQGDSEFTFPAGTTLPSGTCLLVVGFDPADTATLNAFRTYYALPASTRIVGPFTPRLANSAHLLEIARPVAIAGNTAYGATDRVVYRDASPWPTTADGGGRSLQRTAASAIGNTASNWVAATPTPGAVSLPVPYSVSDPASVLRWTAGLETVPAGYLTRFDLASNGAVDLADAVRVARKAAGLEANP